MTKKGLQNIDNPAMAFITTEELTAKLPPIEKPNPRKASPKQTTPPITLNRFGVESKTKRVQLVLKPSVHRRLMNLVKDMAETTPYISMNSLVNEWIEDKLNQEGY